MNKDKLLSGFQRFGKVLMAPVMLLPISGILVGVGSAMTNPSMLKVAPLLANPFFSLFFKLMRDAGNVVNNNIAVLFTISLAYGFAKSEKGTAALSGFLGFMTLNTVMGTLLTAIGSIDPKNLLTGQRAILGVLTLDTGVFGGIIVGLLVAYLHNKFYKIQLPQLLSIFNGTRFVPAVTIVASSFLGVLLSFIFPPIQQLLNYASTFIIATGAFGAFFYGLAERLLLPFGLHHFIYLPFFFTSLGGVMDVGGTQYEGAVNIYTAILNTPDALFDISVSRFVMNGKTLFAMFGLPGAALAIYHTAKSQHKKNIATLMIAATIPAALMGITEPLEYSFLFVAPVLFVVHAVLSGFAYLFTYLLEINIAGTSGFGGPLISFIFNGILQADKGSNWMWLPLLGVGYFATYYFIFKTCIQRFNLLTPGREATTLPAVETTAQTTAELIIKIVEAVGGAANILQVDACFTRLRLTLANNSLVANHSNLAAELQASGIVVVANGVQIIYGNKAILHKTEMREYLGLE
ncbi:MAG: PTS transporter subunit EIIC [Culicoidibacterales bacterium]